MFGLRWWTRLWFLNWEMYNVEIRLIKSMRKGIEKIGFLKKWFENGCFWGLMSEICMVLLARACGSGVFYPNVAEKSVFWFQKTLNFVGISVKKWTSSRNGSRKNMFEVWVVESIQLFSANFTVIVVSGQTLLQN